MSRCLDCGKEDDGILCAHCLAKRASKVGNGAKKVRGLLLALAPTIVTMIVAKHNGKPKI
jgi:hypothetical protein